MNHIKAKNEQLDTLAGYIKTILLANKDGGESAWAIMYSPIGLPLRMILRTPNGSPICTFDLDCVDSVERGPVVLGFYATFHNVKDISYSDKLTQITTPYIEGLYFRMDESALECCLILQEILADNDSSKFHMPYVNLSQHTEPSLIRHLTEITK
jgi:hypothetical protein